ncbi:MAG: DUF401 family protein [Bacillota bacterium]|nr:DUF401 family protein [Bacillota bacterium]MDW7676926.1 DUF401 family protein [Bacillota bacterium]
MDVVKIILVLVLLIIMLRRHIHMAAVMGSGTILLSLLFGMSMHETFTVFLITVSHPSTLHTALALLLIMVLENLMRQKKLLEKLVVSLKILFKDYRVVMPLPPAFMGLLPSAGGALFSAPMVSSACGDHPLSAERKGVINFWYRHVWECVLPLYPAMIIASEIMGVEMARFIRNTYPFTLLAILLGIPYLVYQMKNCEDIPASTTAFTVVAPEASTSLWGDLMRGILPIVVVLLLFFAAHLPLAAALTLVILPMTLLLKVLPSEWVKLLKESVSIKILLILFGIMVFKNMLEATGAVDSLVTIFTAQGIPVTVLTILIPFLVAFLTGMSQAYVAITFPILLGMTPEVDLPLMALAYVSGFAGLMLSPMHLCLVLTAEFYQARIGKMMIMMLPPLTIMVGMGWLLSWIR